MANYNCAIRTNYFHVKNEEAFLDLMNHTYGCDDAIEVFERKDQNGNKVFGFGVYGCIAGFMSSKVNESNEPYYDDKPNCYDESDDEYEPSYKEFIERLQECIADDDAVIIIEVGNEKLRFLVGSATILTSTNHKYLNIQELAIKEAGKILNNPSWTTKCEL